MNRLFLDHNATTPLGDAAREAMIAAMDMGNPSSVYAEGRKAKALMEQARSEVQTLVNGPQNGVIFTSGGTEAIFMALYGMVHMAKPVRRLMIGATEHDAVVSTAASLANHHGVIVEMIPVDNSGALDQNWLRERLISYDVEADGAFAVCVMLANNETGVIQDLLAVTPLIFQAGGYLFMDAVQAAGKIPVDMMALQADAIAISAHKLGGPKGVGALITKPGLALAPVNKGGGQELRRRGGTENIIGIAGFGAAVSAIDLDKSTSLSRFRDDLEEKLRIQNVEGFRIWGVDAARLPNTLCFCAPGFASEMQVMSMDLEGIAISAGAACSSGKVNMSPVMKAMGASEAEAKSTIRVSLGAVTTQEDINRFVEAWAKAYARAVKKAA